MKRIMVAAVIALAVAGCSRDSREAKTDSASAVDSASAANSAGTLEGSPATAGTIDSAKAPINSTEGTIGETRKPASNAPRDSAVAGPYGTIDSLGHIKK